MRTRRVAPPRLVRVGAVDVLTRGGYRSSLLQLSRLSRGSTSFDNTLLVRKGTLLRHNRAHTCLWKNQRHLPSRNHQRKGANHDVKRSVGSARETTREIKRDRQSESSVVPSADAAVSPPSIRTRSLLSHRTQAHPSCVHLADIGDVIHSYAWLCNDCKRCEVCQKKEREVRGQWLSIVHISESCFRTRWCFANDATEVRR